MRIILLDNCRSELLQNTDAFLSGGMSTEQRIDKTHHTLGEGLGMDDIELGDIFTVDMTQTRIARNLAEG